MPADDHLNSHLANERTFLAWIRTSIGIMALGFVVEKFALFMRQISFYLEKTGLPRGRAAVSNGYSSLFGIAIVAVGALLGVCTFFRYKDVERQIEAGTSRPSRLLDLMLAVSVLAIGILLAGYLIRSV
ncbi:MAG: YidH family protein [Elusimicrobiota bacterium]